jgi:hypothetical protein
MSATPNNARFNHGLPLAPKCGYLQRGVERSLRPAVLRRRHVIDETSGLAATVRKGGQERRTGAGCAEDALEITRPQRGPNPSTATSKTPKTAREISAVLPRLREARSDRSA